MAHLQIKNIGPVREIDIDLNRINVFLGPQSSGKSTIAKILSFCQWMQKDVVVRQSTAHIDDSYVQKNLVDYHNISSYFRPDSEFHYRGRCVDLDFADGKLAVCRSGGFTGATVAKNAYIPSERNIIGVPQSLNMEMPYNYLRSFMTDWMTVREKFRRDDAVRLLDLGASYFYNESSREDMIVIDDDPERPLPLSQASSGLQSATPLYVYFKYLTEWIYQHDEDRSPQRLKIIREGSARGAIAAEYPILQDAPNDETMKKIVERLARASQDSDSSDSLISRLREIESRLMRPDFSNIVVEEPEQNLFPQTQAALIYSMLAMIDPERDNLTITTHSPFVVYALNNCMMAWLAGDRTAKLSHLSFGDRSKVNPAAVSVWELRDGCLKAPGKALNATIQDADGLIRDNYFDRVMKGLMTDFRNLLTVIKS